ncbi:prepilin peptidase [Candidatus Parcubacteria bacterium]|nr:prepilin peptidase [Candidatus Parcubacteria bacterium]
MTTVILLVFGAIIGSFLNVVGLRFNSGLSLGGRSFCPHCGKHLKWYELVPVLSFFVLKGKCFKCQSKISWQYPLIEILTALIFLSIYNLQYTIYNKIFLILAFCIYIVVLIYDLRHKIIPDRLVYSLIILSIVYRLLFGGTLLDWLAGPILFVFFGLVWLISRGRAMGFGDAKLVLSIGLLLGAAHGFSAIILGFWIGAGFGLLLILLLRGSKKITMKSEIPFGPFLILGAWLALIFNLDLLHVLSF